MKDLTPEPFKGQDIVLGAPAGWDADKHGPCSGLPIKREDGVCMSVWGLTIRQRLAVLFGGKIVLRIVSGQTQPPVMLSVSKRGEIL